MSNAVHILQKFKSNTDAIATNQGFYYQYLITLNDWLDNYLNEDDIDIYCEMEDDIRAHDRSKNHINFTQVKAYAADFSITSNDVKKAVVNFFHLYSEYKDKGTSTKFIFQTSSDFEGDIFEHGSVKLTATVKASYALLIADILKAKFLEKHRKNKNKIKIKIKESKEYIDKTPYPNKNQIDKLHRSKKENVEAINEKDKIDKEFIVLDNFIKSETPDFFDKIEWKAGLKDKNDVIAELNQSINAKIAMIDGFKIDTNSAYGHLINKVLIASQSISCEGRLLNRTVINDLIISAKEVSNFRNTLQSAELQPIILKLNEAQIFQQNTLERLEEGQTEILTQLKKSSSGVNYAPNSFTDFENDVFSYAEKDFYKKAIRKIKTLTPRNIFDKHEEKLFYPYESNVSSAIEQLSKEKLNNKLWTGWLELLVLMYLQNGQEPDLNQLKLRLNDNDSAIVKSYFTHNKKYSDFIEELLDDDAELVEDGSCFIFNSVEPLRPPVYPKGKIANIIKDISSESSFNDLNPLENKKFGIMNLENIMNTLAVCDDKTEMVAKIERLINDAVT